ncbi:hypothetical protein IVB38_34595 [Bradyrhizobium sp. 38]|uniref:hypothetical protein n=1 Tax=unclassified Bradyrhizobium TaxID=2631580 RepID=UPI001FF9B442|nr:MULTISPECIES: hypothetical protein [unclassified Bradyrhizobium]MCK1341010.1 hypothetical protein [Bradyrhizobium sp. 38]MCK1780981.1 hypothetical protein [Bradyrhizobium sp. 132]
MAGGSHTNFDPGAFTVGAAGGALSIAGAVAAGVQNYVAARAERWAAWTLEQLRCALDLSESLRCEQYRELLDARARVAELERQIADRAFVLKRDRARLLLKRR